MKKLITLCIALCLPLGAQTKKPVSSQPTSVTLTMPVLTAVPTVAKCEKQHWPNTSICLGTGEGIAVKVIEWQKEEIKRMVMEKGAPLFTAAQPFAKQEKPTFESFSGSEWATVGAPVDDSSAVVIEGKNPHSAKIFDATTTVSVHSKDGLRIDRMSDEEYAKRQAARKALADMEAEIVKAHSVDTRGDYMVPVKDFMVCTANGYPAWSGDSMACYMKHKADAYEIKGQFIIIQSGGAK